MKYCNPVIRGFNPDPSVCRVGNDYYLVTSTFEYYPGIPIYHSTDLINWEHISNAVTRPSQLPLVEAEASGGIWAPTIRFNDGMFYITATFSSRGNFIISASDPRGEWSDAIWTDMDGIDPSIIFDNGKMYYCANDCGSRSKLYKTEGISLAEMNPETGKVIGEIKRIWDGTGEGWLESPHIYHIDDWYYILAAEGGTGIKHIEVAARSHSIWGPYEACPYNPILTNRNDITKQAACAGHADLVETPDGGWYMTHLATRPYVSGGTPLGRETFLTPVTWCNGWPVAAENKMARIENNADINAEQTGNAGFECDFKTGEWEPQWLFVRDRDEKYIKRENGLLTLYPSSAKITDTRGVPSMAAVRQVDFVCEIETELDFIPCENGDEAGAAVYLSPKNIYRIAKKRDNGVNYIITEKRAGDFIQEIYREEVTDGRIRFKINADKEKYKFFYSVNDGEFIYAGDASAKFMTTDIADRCFTGTVTGVYTQSEKSTSAKTLVYRYTAGIEG
ncbi:MAG: glycoside hydrolase family 43 protein [Oscillospiraceae bacterium]|nr:glycoside hydrolase family 43 protein [Oscillospiraceae bacterium]